MKSEKGAKKRRPAGEASLPSFSSRAGLPSSRYLFFGGKGGVGKTTAAAAAALYLLDQAGSQKSGEQILLFSTDPAHSLSDSLGIKIGDRLVEVARHGDSRLLAYEMDASVALAKFKAEHRAILGEIAERGSLLDESDIDELLNLSLPGMDEVMALFELSEFDRTNSYTRVVVDTAPSGHTSRLLQLPEVFSHMVRALDRMADKHRYLVAHFAGGRRAREDEIDLFLRDLAERIERVRTMLYDKSRAAFTLVTIPEAMGVEETMRYYALLQQDGVPVTDLIVNRVESEHEKCPYCHARVEAQKPWLEQITRHFEGLRPHHAPLLAGEVRGLDALRRFAQIVWGQADIADAKGAAATADTKSRSPSSARSAPHTQGEHHTEFFAAPRRLLIFGGKGGVGKTTSAAAAALALAERNRDARVLIFSIDPAHSLSDSFDERVGELKRRVGGQANLDGMEIDPAARFEELRKRYRTWIDELFDSLTGSSGWEIQFDREAMRELVALAPPGIDEIAALSAISDLLDQGGYTSIVLDTAPTGHLVRFLELPEVALSWVRTFIKLLLKYKSVVRSTGVAEELIALSKNIKRVIALLTDAEQCEFIGVAIPEHMSLEETARLAGSLEQLKIPMRRLLINMFVPAEAAASCDFCAARHRSQESVIKAFQKRLQGVSRLYIAPQQPHDIRGRRQLREHLNQWRPVAALLAPSRASTPVRAKRSGTKARGERAGGR